MQYIVKREGSIVKFEQTKITRAIFLAAQSVGGTDTTLAEELSDEVVEHIEERFGDQRVTIENIQDIVETILIKKGHAKTAKAYILYRADRAKRRDENREKILQKIYNKQAEITLRDGSVVLFQPERILEKLEAISYNLRVDNETLLQEACSNLYKGITLDELLLSLINTSRSRIELSVDYSYLGSRLLLEQLYNNIIDCSFIDKEQLRKNYQNKFRDFVCLGIEDGTLDKRLQTFDLQSISQNIDWERDLLFQYRGLQTLHDRYLLRRADHTLTIYELPQFFWLRVSMGLALNEKEEQKTEMVVKFYNTISQMDFIPSTPTLFNSGTTHPQLSSCFLNTAEDSLEGIFKTYQDNALLSKYAGGIGTDWTNIRSLGSRIKGTNGKSQGVIPFLKIFNDIAIAVNQGGKRQGAMCAYLEVWHGDVEEFIESKKNTGDDRRRLHDVHTALWVPDLFMKRVIEGKQWTLFSSVDVPDLHSSYGKEFEEKYEQYEQMGLPSAKTLLAKELWKKILTMLFETGHPWITFKDACNIRNPQSHTGVINSSNLCTEITLNSSLQETAVCNLGSINLSNMVQDKKINEQLLKETVATSIRMLDNVIDVNYYPTKEAKNSNQQHRPIGLGIMGYQDALYKMDIPFTSEEHVEFADATMEKISYYAISASSELSLERGSYPSFKNSKWDKGLFPLDTYKMLLETRGEYALGKNENTSMDWDSLKDLVKKNGMRNSNCLAIAPTATISNISGITPCIEPVFRNIYVKENTDGSFIVVNEFLMEDLKKIGLWNKDIIEKIKYFNGNLQRINEIPHHLKNKYQEAFEIDPQWILRSAARRSKWIDQSQSINIFSTTRSGKVINDIYILAWKLGLKTTYYLRTLGVSHVEKNI